MPVFDTPGSITVTLEIGVGNVRVTASERTDTVVEVRPTNAADESDVKAAQQIRVDYTDGELRLTGPRPVFDFSKKTRSCDISIEVPADSRLTADLQAGDIRCAGRLGRTRLKSFGEIRVERSGPLRINTSGGHITADEVTGDADVSTGTGRIQLGHVQGKVVVKNSNGDTLIDSAGGDVRVRAVNGDIQVDRAGAGVDAKSHNGSIRLGEVARGSIVLAASMGNLDVGIADGTAAWLEVDTQFGKVHNLLDNVTAPGEADETVEVRGHTAFGDVTIRRS